MFWSTFPKNFSNKYSELLYADSFDSYFNGWHIFGQLTDPNFKRRKLSKVVIMMMMNYFCGMVDRQKAFSLISSRNHCQRYSPPRISDASRAGFEPAQSLSSGFVEWSCAVVITTTPRYLLAVKKFYAFQFWFCVTQCSIQDASFLKKK